MHNELPEQCLVECLRTTANNLKQYKPTNIHPAHFYRIYILLEDAADEIERLRSYWYTAEATKLIK